MRRALAMLAAALLALSSPAMTPAEYAQFRALVNRANAQLTKVEYAVANLEDIAGSYDEIITAVSEYLKRYVPSRWHEANEKLTDSKRQIEEAMADCKYWYGRVQEAYMEVSFAENGMETLMRNGYGHYSRCDRDASRFLAAIYAVPTIVSQDEWQQVYGRFTAIDFNPEDYMLPNPVQINFNCGCNYATHDAEYEAMLAQLPDYRQMLADLTAEFNELKSSTEVPQ